MKAAEWRAEIAKYEAMARARGIEPAEIYSAAGITRADSELETILASDKKLIDVVVKELSEVSKNLGTPRRTVLSTSTVAPATTAARVASAQPEALQIEDRR